VRASTLDSIVMPIGPRLGAQVVEAKGLSKGYGERLLIDNLNFNLPPGAVVGVVGGNGAGKTTLFRMIMGQETADGGELVVGSTVRPMCVDQSRDALNADNTVYQELCGGADEIVIGGRAVSSRAYCTWYNFRGGDQQKRVGDLSGGERNRLQLAKTLLQGGNLLLLDEPSSACLSSDAFVRLISDLRVLLSTDDIDLDTLRCLEEAIAAFAGSIIVISHDRWFLERIATHILAYEGDSHVHWFEGSYSEYEADRKRRMPGSSEPGRLKYRPMAQVG
jgi:ATPase subunit of ABC transporter with duplicated ATPase domains